MEQALLCRRDIFGHMVYVMYFWGNILDFCITDSVVDQGTPLTKSRYNCACDYSSQWTSCLLAVKCRPIRNHSTGQSTEFVCVSNVFKSELVR